MAGQFYIMYVCGFASQTNKRDDFTLCPKTCCFHPIPSSLVLRNWLCNIQRTNDVTAVRGNVQHVSVMWEGGENCAGLGRGIRGR